MPVTFPDNKLTPIIHAIEENLCEHFSFVHRHTKGMRVQDSAEFLQTDSGLSCDTFNQVTRAKLTVGSERSAIRDMVTYFSMRKRPFAWWVGPESRPADIEKHLLFSGMKQTEEEIGMAIELPTTAEPPAKPEGLVIREVIEEHELVDYAAVLAANWDPPDEHVRSFYLQAAHLLLRPSLPMRLYVAYLDKLPVATGELFVSRHAAGLYNLCTLEEFRNRGIGTFMTWQLVQYAQKEGHKLAVLQASKAGLPVYEKLGFTTHCSYAVYNPIKP